MLTLAAKNVCVDISSAWSIKAEGNPVERTVYFGGFSGEVNTRNNNTRKVTMNCIHIYYACVCVCVSEVCEKTPYIFQDGNSHRHPHLTACTASNPFERAPNVKEGQKGSKCARNKANRLNGGNLGIVTASVGCSRLIGAVIGLEDQAT